MVQAFRSALFNALMVTSVTIFASCAYFIALPLSYHWRYHVLSAWGRFATTLAYWVCGLGFEVEGREHLPGRASIILANHQSMWETIAFQGIFPPHTWVLKRELMRIPIFGWALALMKPVAIDRASRKEAMQQVIQQGRERLDAGIWVMVFPEGTRAPPGQPGRYRLGGAVLAAETGALVVPVAHNAGSFWPRRSFVKRPGTITVRIGPPIPTQGRKAEEILDEARAWIVRTQRELEEKAAASLSGD